MWPNNSLNPSVMSSAVIDNLNGYVLSAAEQLIEPEGN